MIGYAAGRGLFCKSYIWAFGKEIQGMPARDKRLSAATLSVGFKHIQCNSELTETLVGANHGFFPAAIKPATL